MFKILQAKTTVLFFIIVLFLCSGAFAFPGPWQEVKDKHFVVLYKDYGDQADAYELLRKAEEYYTKVAGQIGYSKYANFWTWNERVKIYIFPSQEEFARETHQPPWSRGYVVSDARLLSTRMIVTYRQEDNFSNGLLPHEISHLLLRDFIGFDRYIPVWFDEGVAQLQEEQKRSVFYKLMRKKLAQRNFIPLRTLNRMIISGEEDQKQVLAFYAQSLTVVDFLLKEYGTASFSQLCRNLREGKKMEEAMRSAYGQAFRSFENLEEKWMKYIERH